MIGPGKKTPPCPVVKIIVPCIGLSDDTSEFSGVLIDITLPCPFPAAGDARGCLGFSARSFPLLIINGGATAQRLNDDETGQGEE